MEQDQMQWLWLHKNVLKRDKASTIKQSVSMIEVRVENDFAYFKTAEYSNTFCFCLERGKGGQYIKKNKRVFIYFWNCSTQHNPDMLYVKKVKASYFS